MKNEKEDYKEEKFENEAESSEEQYSASAQPAIELGLPKIRLSHAPAGPNAYRRMIASADRNAKQGDLVAVYDKNGRLYGVAIYNPRSQICIRILTRENLADFTIEKYLDEKITRAVELRRDILKIFDTGNACRLIHDYADGMPGLTADYYNDNIVLEFYSVGMFKLAEKIEQAFLKHFPNARFHHRATAHTQEMEGFELPEQPDLGKGSRTRITENGVLFEVNLRAGFKTGFFCDQRDNRAFAASLAKDKAVLDLCSYTGGFGIYAAKAGAKSVTCVELDQAASAQCKRNANINQVRVDCVCGDAFMYMRQMIANKKQYDMVILDPYKLIASRDDYEYGLFKYRDFNRIALSLVKPGGIFITCSCSGLVDMKEFNWIVRGAGHAAGRKLQILRKSGAGGDHPVAAEYPEGEYLKCIACRVF